MRSPLRVEFFSDLDRNGDYSASTLGFGAKPSRWGHPMGRVWFSSHSIETKSSLDSWSVFLQDGVTLSGQILAI